MPQAVRFLPVDRVLTAPELLYDLLRERERETWISTTGLPSYEEHVAFVTSKPYRYWYLLFAGEVPVGELHATELNEIGLSIFKRHQGQHYGSQAIRHFIDMHAPLPPITSKRNRHWLANIGVENTGSKAFFASLGFRPLQETWVFEKDNYNEHYRYTSGLPEPHRGQPGETHAPVDPVSGGDV